MPSGSPPRPTAVDWWELRISKGVRGLSNPGLQTILVLLVWLVSYPVILLLTIWNYLPGPLGAVALLLNSEGFVSTAVLLYRAGHRLGDQVVESLEGAVEEAAPEGSPHRELLTTTLDQYDPAIRRGLNGLGLIATACWTPGRDHLVQAGLSRFCTVVGTTPNTASTSATSAPPGAT